MAGYLAKYATKDANSLCEPGEPQRHLTRLGLVGRELADRARKRDLESPYLLLGKWAHMLGFRGHFSTKSRRYSVTLGVLRRARHRFQTLVSQARRAGEPLDVRDIEERLLADEKETTLVIGSWTYQGTGWTPAETRPSPWADDERVGMGHLRETTTVAYRNACRHVDASFGRWTVAKIEHADVADWVTSISARSGPDLVRYAHRVLCLVLDHAMRTRRVSVKVARGVRLPKRPPARNRFLTAPQVHALVERLGRDGDLVLAMTYLRLRWSELAALKVADADLGRRRVHVVERATEVGGRMNVSAPKSAASNRHVAIPGMLHRTLSERVEGKAADELVFCAPNGGTCETGIGGSAQAWTLPWRPSS